MIVCKPDFGYFTHVSLKVESEFLGFVLKENEENVQVAIRPFWPGAIKAAKASK